MSLDKQALFWLAATVGGYLLSRQLYRRVKWYWLSPIVFVPVLLWRWTARSRCRCCRARSPRRSPWRCPTTWVACQN